MKKFAFKLLSIICCLCFIFPCFSACGNKDNGEPKYRLEDYFIDYGELNNTVQSFTEMQTKRTSDYSFDEIPNLKPALGLTPKPNTKVKITKITGNFFYSRDMYGSYNGLTDDITTTIFDRNISFTLADRHVQENLSITCNLILTGPEMDEDGHINYEDWDSEENSIDFFIKKSTSTTPYIRFHIHSLKVWFEPIT